MTYECPATGVITANAPREDLVRIKEGVIVGTDPARETYGDQKYEKGKEECKSPPVVNWYERSPRCNFSMNNRTMNIFKDFMSIFHMCLYKIQTRSFFARGCWASFGYFGR